MTEYQVPVLILGSFTTALGSLRAFGAASVPVYCLTPQLPFVKASKWFRGPPPGAPILEDTDGLAAYLAELDLARAVLFPCSDEWVAAVNALEGQYADRFMRALPPKSVLNTLLNKGALERLGAEQDVPRPRTVVLESVEDLTELSDEYFVSAFLKPCESRPFAMRYGVKAFAVDDRDDAVRRWEKVTADGHKMVLQEYIQGPPSEHYLVDGFVDASGEVRSVFPRRRLRMYPLDFGDSSYIRSVPRDEMRESIDGLVRLLQTINYRGIFSAEFKRDGRDQQHKLLEINTRAWTYVEFPLLCGINMPEMAYRDAQGMAVEDAFDYEVGRGMTVLPQDLKAGLALRARGDLGLAEFFGSWWSADSLFFRPGDLKPGLVHVRSLIAHRLRRFFGSA